MEEARSTLEAKVDSLTQVNEGLVIQVESLERDAVDHDRVTTALQASTDAAFCDLDWLLQVGLVRFVDKLIEHSDFTGAVSLIRHFAFVVGAEYIHNTLASVGSGGIVTSAPSSGPIVHVNEALLSFSSMDHASLLGLGDLDIQGV